MYLEDGKLVFDKKNCEDCFQESLTWDDEDFYEKVRRTYGRNYKNPEDMKYSYSKNQKCWVSSPDERLCKDPAKERLYKRRTRSNWHFNESKYARYKIQRRFKMKMKQNIDKEEYYNLRPRDYRTYGWETW